MNLEDDFHCVHGMRHGACAVCDLASQPPPAEGEIEGLIAQIWKDCEAYPDKNVSARFADLLRARSQTVPEGWQLVPIEPTEEMEEAADEPFHAAWKAERERAIKNHGKEGFASVSFSRPIYAAMLKSAPTETRDPDKQDYMAGTGAYADTPEEDPNE